MHIQDMSEMSAHTHWVSTLKSSGGVSELVQEGALKASGPCGPCGFESHHRYQHDVRRVVPGTSPNGPVFAIIDRLKLKTASRAWIGRCDDDGR